MDKTTSSPNTNESTAESGLEQSAPGTWSAGELLTLCTAYWYPLYAFLRRSGRSPRDADALIEGFLNALRDGTLPPEAAALESRALRSFLLEIGKTLLVTDEAVSSPQEEGECPPTWEEKFYRKEPADLEAAPLFERRWAMTVLNHTLQVLRNEFIESGKEASFDQLKHLLCFGPDPEEAYLKVAAKLALDVSTVKHQVFRLRGRWRDLLLQQIAQTLFSPSKEMINEELILLLGSV